MKAFLSLITLALVVWSPSNPICTFSPEAHAVATIAVLKAVAPIYPKCALEARTFGLVRIDAHVDAKGLVRSAVFVGADEKAIIGAIPHAGLQCLREAAERAAQRWLFVSSADRGEAIIRLRFRFMLIDTERATEDLSAVFVPPYDVEVRGLMPKVVIGRP